MSINSESVMKSQKNKKLYAVKAFGGKCCICGYDKCSEALDFHHIDKNEKEGQPSYIIMRWSFERAKKELEKCILVCANCHREIHAKEKEGMSLDTKRYLKPWLEKNCNCCGKKYNTKNSEQKYCSVMCDKLNNRKVERPSKEELAELIRTTNWTQIGNMFKVSDNAVRKWAKNYELI